MRVNKIRLLGAFIVLGLFMQACGGNSSSSKDKRNAAVAAADAVASGLEPQANGFAFPNFGAGATPEQLNGDDLVKM
ncbi:MAG: hypothetical protein WCL35_06750, partial [bacterium]